jgi:hypothetical protein
MLFLKTVPETIKIGGGTCVNIVEFLIQEPFPVVHNGETIKENKATSEL